ncbi:MAG: Zn-dependent oligopeptidase [Deltaproteobacteria bacterium]|nr:Zn-dependent oligopeptidase [Deltaproteobacteria bacterium]
MKLSLTLLAVLSLLPACKGTPPPARPEADPPIEPLARPEVVPDRGSGTQPEANLKPVPPAEDLATTFLAECRAHLTASRLTLDTLGAVSPPRTVENTVEPYNEVLRHALNALEVSGLYSEVHPDPKVRDAGRTCEQDAQKYMSDLMLDKRAYDALIAVDLTQADPTTTRFVTLLLRDHKRAGIALDDAKRTRLKAIDEETTKVSQLFSQAIAEDTRYVEVTDPKRLAGLPADWIAAHKPDANGTIKISTDYPDYIAVAAYANDDALRKELYIAFRARGDKHNEEHLKHLLVLRAEKAKLLGFKDWVDYESDDKMLRTGAKAAEFIERVAALAKRSAQRDYTELLAQLRTLEPKATAVADWQKLWLEKQVKKAKYDIDAQEARKYFDYDRTLAGLLEITSTIFDIQYTPVVEAKAWHPDVKVFDVMRGGEKLGRIFLDMHPREGKYKHAAQFAIKDGVIGKQLPEGALVCNFPGPSSRGTALMDHGDVVTMFHEFGHLMHHVLGGKQRWVRQSGVATEADFVEAPSQMFEEWGWRYETLSRFAKHHETGQVIPKELVEKMRKSYRFGRGSWAAQQLFYAALSFQFHKADPAKLDQVAMVRKLQHEYTPFAYVEGTKFHASFGHLIGYSSRYYTYMWALVIAKDLLTPFEKAGLLDTKTTYRYRDTVLAGGGTKNAADLVKDFLGRPYSFKAFEKYLAER